MPKATVAQIAAQAGVSESTARRYLPKGDPVVASPSDELPAETLRSVDGGALVGSGVG
jgi:AcrR family transcriptional regulator